MYTAIGKPSYYAFMLLKNIFFSKAIYNTKTIWKNNNSNLYGTYS